MPISADELNEFAKALAVDGADEIHIRAAVSRSYYSAFHAVLPFAERLPLSASAPAGLSYVTHKEVTERLREWRVAGVHSGLARLSTTASQLKDTLAAARAARVKADYRMGSTVTLAEAKSQIERARLVKRAMAQISAEMSKGAPAAGTA